MFNDEFAGQGGSYEVGSDGKRKLIERTNMESPAPEPPPPLSEQSTENQPD